MAPSQIDTNRLTVGWIIDGGEPVGLPSLEGHEAYVPIREATVGHEKFSQVLSSVAGVEDVDTGVGERHLSGGKGGEPFTHGSLVEPVQTSSWLGHRNQGVEE
jgi:hypothetical protein